MLSSCPLPIITMLLFMSMTWIFSINIKLSLCNPRIHICGFNQPWMENRISCLWLRIPGMWGPVYIWIFECMMGVSHHNSHPLCHSKVNCTLIHILLFRFSVSSWVSCDEFYFSGNSSLLYISKSGYKIAHSIIFYPFNSLPFEMTMHF